MTSASKLSGATPTSTCIHESYTNSEETRDRRYRRVSVFAGAFPLGVGKGACWRRVQQRELEGVHYYREHVCRCCLRGQEAYWLVCLRGSFCTVSARTIL